MTSISLLRILFVENETRIQDAWRQSLLNSYEGVVESTHAYTLGEAINFIAGSVPDIIVIDSCVPGDTPNTAGFIQEIRLTFPSVRLFGVSSVEEGMEYLVRAGCEHACGKSEILTYLRPFLPSNPS